MALWPSEAPDVVPRAAKLCRAAGLAPAEPSAARSLSSTSTACSMSRPLTLHVSALNDAEFSTYTSSIHDIVEHDASAVSDYDKLVVGVREARAWLRGRYPSLPPASLDAVRTRLPAVGPFSSHRRSSASGPRISLQQMS